MQRSVNERRDVLSFGVMIAGLILIVLSYAGLAFGATAAEYAAVVQVGGCSGVCVTPAGLIMSAKHCGLAGVEHVTFPATGRTVRASRVYVSPEPEGPVILDCDGSGFPFVPMGRAVPQVGELVRGLGYPGSTNQFTEISGKLTGGAQGSIGFVGVRFNVVDRNAYGGMSGGPLLNSNGEVVGLLTGTSWGDSIWISYAATRAAYDQAVRVQRASAAASQRTTIVVFSVENCSPCIEVEEDIRAGVYSDYDVIVVKQNAAGQWNRPDLWAEFNRTCQPQGSIAAPTFWVKGTTQYRSYSTAGGRRGILGWIGGIIRAIVGGAIELIVGGPGEPTPLPVPPISLPPVGVDPPELSPQPEVSALFDEVNRVRELAAKAAADAKAFADAGAIGKLRMIDDLVANGEEIKGELGGLRERVSAVGDAAKENPLQFLWGLWGLVSGLIHRKVDDVPDDDVSVDLGSE